MVKLRLTRTGRKNYASYRVVAIDSRKARESRAIEYLGFYLPYTKQLELNKERIQYWLGIGAQPSETVAGLLVRQGILKKSDLPKRTFKKPAGKKAKERAEAKTAKSASPKTEVPEAEVPAAEVDTETAEAT
jgi:small subunit ribosomal protein S16